MKNLKSSVEKQMIEPIPKGSHLPKCQTSAVGWGRCRGLGTWRWLVLSTGPGLLVPLLSCHNVAAGMRKVVLVTSGLHQEMGLEAAKRRAGVIAALGTFWARKDFRADPRLSEG